jgi:hypothetical protein
MGAPAYDISVLERLPEKARARLQQWAGLLAASQAAARPRPVTAIPGLRLRVTLAAIAVRVRRAQTSHTGPKSSAPTSPGRPTSRPGNEPPGPRRPILECVLPPGPRPAPADPDRADDADTVDLWAAWAPAPTG